MHKFTTNLFVLASAFIACSAFGAAKHNFTVSAAKESSPLFHALVAQTAAMLTPSGYHPLWAPHGGWSAPSAWSAMREFSIRNGEDEWSTIRVCKKCPNIPVVLVLMSGGWIKNKRHLFLGVATDFTAKILDDRGNVPKDIRKEINKTISTDIMPKIKTNENEVFVAADGEGIAGTLISQAIHMRRSDYPNLGVVTFGSHSVVDAPTHCHFATKDTHDLYESDTHVRIPEPNAKDYAAYCSNPANPKIDVLYDKIPLFSMRTVFKGLVEARYESVPKEWAEFVN